MIMYPSLAVYSDEMMHKFPGWGGKEISATISEESKAWAGKPEVEFRTDSTATRFCFRCIFCHNVRNRICPQKSVAHA